MPILKGVRDSYDKNLLLIRFSVTNPTGGVLPRRSTTGVDKNTRLRELATNPLLAQIVNRTEKRFDKACRRKTHG
jgi:hypothetical protein